jgi:hypothetical protein
MSWLKHLFSQRHLFDDLSEEMRDHLDEKIGELVARGMSREEAAARREFRNVTLIEQDNHQVWRWPGFVDVFVDVRYGLRMLRKHPGSRGLRCSRGPCGIGLNFSLFSIVNGVLLDALLI